MTIYPAAMARGVAKGDHIEGQAQVVFCPTPSRDVGEDAATFSRLSMVLVLHGPGVTARPVKVTKTVRSKYHLRPGQVIPVLFDANDHEKYEIQWDRAPKGGDDLLGGATVAGLGEFGEVLGGLGDLRGGLDLDQINRLAGSLPQTPAPPPVASAPAPEGLARLTALRDRGALSADEFDAECRRLSGG